VKNLDPGSAKQFRLQQEAVRATGANWKQWGSYLSERQCGTVREDYSPDGTPWSSFPHDHARGRASRWGEDGLLGITDRQCRLNFSDESRRILRQASSGLMRTKQFYYYVVKEWLNGDSNMPAVSRARRPIRNGDLQHLFNRDIISVPDKWEYPWYAAWDLAFHMVPIADIDNNFARDQLTLFLREWYMHANGQIPASEWNFSDVNPPVHAWACCRVYKKTGPPGRRDRLFLERTFQKLTVNFTWWVNRKDLLGKHVFTSGFPGLDNIGVFDRSRPLPTGGHLHQADGTAWMGFFCARMLTIALELTSENPRTRIWRRSFLNTTSKLLMP
jgi:hypothetical protein